MAKRHLLSFIAICSILICQVNSSLTQGYFYDNPIRPYNPTPFTPLRSTGGQYSNIPFGQKVESTTRLKVPPIPTLPPLTTYIPPQTRKYQSTPTPTATYGRVPTPAPSRTLVPQQIQSYQQPQQTLTLYQKPQQQQVPQPYSYPKPAIQLTNNQQNSYTTSVQQRNNIPQSTQRPTSQFYQASPPSILQNTQRQVPQQSFAQTFPQQTVPQQAVPQRLFPQQTVPQQIAPQQTVPQQTVPQQTVPQQFVPQQSAPQNGVPQQVVPQQAVTTSFADIPTVAVINSNSNPSQTSADLLSSPEIYVVDGRQLKQYKVYEHIDNDIDQEVHNFLPANFFLNSYHSMIGDTHPLGEDLQVQNRASGFQQQRSQLVQQQQAPNTVALGSGGLGFVKLPNGNIYLGSGSLGYISSLQHSQDIQDLRSRTSSSGPDALHFGHGALSDSFYYQNQKD